MKIVDSFYVLDFDRTLVDSDVLAKLIYEAAAPYLDRSIEELVSEQKAAERLHDQNPSNIIDMWSILLSHLGDDVDQDKFEAKIIAGVREISRQSLLPGASELLKKLDQQQVPYMILTKGEPGWQNIKLACVGLSAVPHKIVSSYQKSRYVNEWKVGDGFIIPEAIMGYEISTRRIILIDDRSVGFDGADDSIAGYFVRTGRDKDGVVPTHIKTVDSLTDILSSI